MQLSRRELLHFAWLRSPGAAPDGQASACARTAVAPLFLRPPGALPEPEFLSACTRCDACLIACPRESIRRAGHELGEEHEGTPVILPAEQPCWLCGDLPCIAVCEEGALLPLEAPRDARLGSVRVHEDACYAAQGSLCDVCVERCPVQPKAIAVSRGEAPALDLALCTGCAVCAWLCPARAIEVLPSPLSAGATGPRGPGRRAP